MIDQKIIFFIGPDNSGKTTIAKELSKQLEIPYFKNSTEKKNLSSNIDFINSLEYEGYFLYSFLFQTKVSIIKDRDFPCEYAYSQTFNRKTNLQFIWELDNLYSNLNTFLIYCYKDEYIEEDEYIEKKYIKDIQINYEEFLKLTKNKFIILNTTSRNLSSQLKIIKNFILGEFNG